MKLVKCVLKLFMNLFFQNVPIQTLLSISIGVAKGMEHIIKQNFIHCDLAARNCM